METKMYEEVFGIVIVTLIRNFYKAHMEKHNVFGDNKKLKIRYQKHGNDLYRLVCAVFILIIILKFLSLEK